MDHFLTQDLLQLFFILARFIVRDETLVRTGIAPYGITQWVEH